MLYYEAAVSDLLRTTKVYDCSTIAIIDAKTSLAGVCGPTLGVEAFWGRAEFQ